MECVQEDLKTENLNIEDLLTPNEVFDTIKMFDETVEIIGYVDGIEPPRLVGSNQQYKFYKFYLNNNKGRRVQIVAWNDNIENVERHVMSNHIIHIDGALAKMPKEDQFNNGNVNYEILINSHTIVSNLGLYEPIKTLKDKPKRIEMKDVLNNAECISLEGYIKTNFFEYFNTNLKKIILCGSITDGTYKLEIHILDFSKNLSKRDLKKGDKIEVVGRMQNNANPPYLVVNNLTNINRKEGRMPIPQLLKGVNTLKKEN